LLGVGTKLGRYEIRSKIGEGGMGEVYLAQDTQLDRAIALKLLSADIARDQQRLHRFLQEARAAAALSHPNIAHIYEIGEANGGYFIAMEYVAGTTLDQKIGGRPLPISESLEIAIQIADALDEAHGKGITHRDIKSSNVMITPRGRVKVLDFGLAKMTQAPGSSQPGSDSQVATRVKTSPGVVMGTVNYMSPEQASGQPVDARTDIWSVGVVLYEMATAHMPFEGATPSHVIVAILEKEPVALSGYVPNMPEALEWIVTETLTKDRDERTQTARELMKRLQRLKQRIDADAEVERSVAPDRLTGSAVIPPPSNLTVSGAPGIAQSTSSQSAMQTSGVVTATHVSSAEYVVNQIKSHKQMVALAGVVALAVLAGIGFAIYTFVVRRQSNPVISMEAATFTRLTTTGNAIGAVISPDGKWLVHVQDDGEQQSLWLRQVAVENSNTQIVAPAKVVYRGAAFSPDGNYVYYGVRQGNEGTGTLYQIAVLGGTPRKLFTGFDSSLSFSPDGKQMAYFYFYEDEDRLMIANTDGTGQRQLAMRRGDEYFFRGNFSFVSWSPDGKTIATPIANTSQNYMSVATVSVATGEVKVLTLRKWYLVRQVVWFDGATVLATATDESGTSYNIWRITYPSGEVTKLSNDLNSYPTISLTADARVIAAVKTEFDTNIWVMPAFDAARATQITKGRNLVGTPAWTPDGKILFPQKAANGGDLYLMDPTGGPRTQLTSNAGANVGPSISRDGRYIVFMSDRTGPPQIWRMNIDGTNLKQLTDKYQNDSPSISPDGQWVAYLSCMNKCTVWRVGIDGGQPIQITDHQSEMPAVSPDGKRIACSYLESETAPFSLAIFPAAGGRPLQTFAFPTGVNTNLHWTLDGQTLVYGVTRSGVTNLWTQPLDGSPPKQLTSFASERIFSFDISRDGKQVALSRGVQTSDVVLISNFKR
jgi:serine/threonine protein kinase/Tol biopolymer transport system component